MDAQALDRDRLRLALDVATERAKTPHLVRSDAEPAFRLGEVLQALAASTRGFQPAEYEAAIESRALAELAGTKHDPLRPHIPWSALLPAGRRDLTAGTPSAGGHIVGIETDTAAAVLRRWSVITGAGCTVLPNLRDGQALPRIDALPTAYWLASESTQTTEAQPTLGTVTLTPRTVACYTEISRRLNLQAPHVEDVLRRAFGQAIGQAIDAAIVSGDGTGGKPTGLQYTAGVGSQVGTSFDWTKAVAMRKTIADTGADDRRIAWIAAPGVQQLLSARERITGSGRFIWDGLQIAGHDAHPSAALAAGTLALGDWSQLVVAVWGTPQIEVNPYALFQSGILGVRLMVSVDIGVIQPASFSLTTSIT